MAWQQPLYFEIVYVHVASKKQEYHSAVLKLYHLPPNQSAHPPFPK